ncbi:heterokaryon incompatibility protein-domain-containing protein [Xylariomycetidae sp. FL0641]|nr:heterokaryon incompatibility protein-domain-containing protein [Xylariomycetidae sp. FL0641]
MASWHLPTDLRNIVTSMYAPYTYAPLEDEDSIRLLQLLPAEHHEDVLRSTLLHTSLKDQEDILFATYRYTALSYVWGDPEPVDAIHVDGYQCGITANLAAALRDLRDAGRAHLLWADALCIDQKNITERNQQVSLMPRIYHYANNTIIYLGPIDVPIRWVFDFVPQPRALDPTRPRLTGDAEPDPDTVVKICERHLLSRPWFSRVWVMQELCFSRAPWVQCGRKRVPWSDFCRLLPGSRDKKSDILFDLQTNRNRIQEIRPQVRVPETSPGLQKGSPYEGRLYQILLSRKHCRSTDPRDVIFAHLGICADRNAAMASIEVDYSRSIRDVYVTAARYFIKQVHLTGLYEEAVRNTPFRSLLPSWVPDWGADLADAVLQKEIEEAPPCNPWGEIVVREIFGEPVQVLQVSDVLPGPSYLRKGLKLPRDLRQEWREDPWLILRLWLELIKRLAVWQQPQGDQDETHPMNWSALYPPEEQNERLHSYLMGEIVQHCFSRTIPEDKTRYRLALLTKGYVAIVEEHVTRGDTLLTAPSSSPPYDSCFSDSPHFPIRSMHFCQRERFDLDQLASIHKEERLQPSRVAIKHCVLATSSCRPSCGCKPLDKDSEEPGMGKPVTTERADQDKVEITIKQEDGWFWYSMDQFCMKQGSMPLGKPGHTWYLIAIH